MEGGFAYRNNGIIENCYADVKIGTAIKIGRNKHENAGLVYENNGELQNCFSRSIVRTWKKGRNGLIVTNQGHCQHCFFITESNKALKKFRDKELGFAKAKTKPEFLESAFQWDFTAFERELAEEMQFEKEFWHYEPGGAVSADHTTVEISNQEQFLKWIDDVNHGKTEAANAKIFLTDDIDFHGKTIPTVGCDKQHPFSGTFDGGGHHVRGFVLSGREMTETGLFGYLDGTVQNLSIDCIVKGAACPLVAAFCAVNNGEIHCCEAICAVYAKRYTGMFVGENHGKIERCRVSGKSRATLIWQWFLLPFLILLFIVFMNPLKPPKEYVPIMADASIVQNKEEKLGKRNNDNKVSFEVSDTLVVDAATLTTQSESYVINNPSRGANYDFVATLYMTDSNGNDVEVYRSGRIPIGYHIKSLTLVPPGGVTLSEGYYKAKLVFSFYHHDSGEKGMVDSDVPITIKIQ